MAGDEATLKKTLEGFDESMKSRKEQLDTLENQARSIRKKQEEISRNLNTITGQRGQLQEKRAQNVGGMDKEAHSCLCSWLMSQCPSLCFISGTAGG